jgi:DNA-binding NarL/FixJ family response regulator
MTPSPDAGPERISVALVEDDDGARERFERVINASAALDLRHSAVRGGAMLEWLADEAVDVLLVDLGLPDMSGLELIRRVNQLQPVCEVLVITLFGDETNMLNAFAAGARGYLLKDGTEDQLAEHIRHLRAGGSPISPLIARRLLKHVAITAPTASTPANTEVALTAKESEVLNLLARGLSYAEAARANGVTVHTIRTQIRNIYSKLNVNSNTQAIFEARALGLIRP